MICPHRHSGAITVPLGHLGGNCLHQRTDLCSLRLADDLARRHQPLDLAHPLEQSIDNRRSLV